MQRYPENKHVQRACSLCFFLLLLACSKREQAWVSTVGSRATADAGSPRADAQSSPSRMGDASRVTTAEPAKDSDPDLSAPPLCAGGCTDFPEAPFVELSDPAITDDEIAAFSDPDALAPGAFCLLEPQLSNGSRPGALFPQNWLRPRFRWEGGQEDALYEVRLHSAFERHDVRAYTRGREWTLPKDVWTASSRALRKVTVTVRALGKDGKLSGVRGTFQIAPVEASGSLVFWATTSSEVGPTTSMLHGFSVGDEAVVELLRSADVATAPVLHENGRDVRGEYGGKPGFGPGEVQCIGCHAGTPDGKGVVFTDDFPWSKVVTSLEPEKLGSTPLYLSAGAETLLKQPWLGTQTMSQAHWRDGDRIVVASYGTRDTPFGPYLGGRDALVWFDLETKAQIPSEVPANGGAGPTRDAVRDARSAAITAARGSAWDVIATDGEERNAVTPSFSHDGTRIAYVSTDRAPNGHPAYEANVADIKVVPYRERAGGVAEPLAGASSPDWLEYHPAFSPDDRFITFTRAPRRGPSPDGPYYNRNGEIYVVRSDGSEAPVRLLANDPVACSGELSPGVLNSWSKWSPAVRGHDGKTYYFLVFSSARRAPDSFDIPRSQYTPATLDTRSSQLYMASFSVDAAGVVESYPAVYLWNQNRLLEGGVVGTAASSNLTPAWDELEMPPIVVF